MTDDRSPKTEVRSPKTALSNAIAQGKNRGWTRMNADFAACEMITLARMRQRGTPVKT